MNYPQQSSRSGIVILIIILLLIGTISYFAWKYNSFHIQEQFDDYKNKAIDVIDNRPRQMITQDIPTGKEFCIINDYTNIIGWDTINNCCVYEWRKNNNILQTCITAQIGGETKYSIFNNIFIEDYKNYLSEVK